MTELLLRGDQTVGELRGRASRMEPIADLAALRPVLDSLRAKGLVVSLTPEGRGHVVAHALFRPREIEALKAKYQGGAGRRAGAEDEGASVAGERRWPRLRCRRVPRRRRAWRARPPSMRARRFARNWPTFAIRMAQLRSDLDEAHNAIRQISDDVRALKEALGG